MDPFRSTSLMLARQVLGFEGHEDRRPHPATGDPGLASARLQVELRLESMVRGICQQLWVDSAAVSANAEAQIREAIEKFDIEAEIAKAVAAEMSSARWSIVDRVRKRVGEVVDRAIDERLGNLPKLLAKKVTDKMLDALYDVGYPRGSNIYGRRSAPRRKK